jgi:hypothetical protein
MTRCPGTELNCRHADFQSAQFGSSYNRLGDSQPDKRSRKIKGLWPFWTTARPCPALKIIRSTGSAIRPSCDHSGAWSLRRGSAPARRGWNALSHPTTLHAVTSVPECVAPSRRARSRLTKQKAHTKRRSRRALTASTAAKATRRTTFGWFAWRLITPWGSGERKFSRALLADTCERATLSGSANDAAVRL